MTKEFEFFSFLIEQYAAYKKTTSDIVLRKWDELNVTNTIFNMYELYHCEELQNAFIDIERICSEQEK